jgi:hypothetical protein
MMSAADGALPVTAAYTSLGEAFDGLTAVEQALRARHDRRAIFVTAYLVITDAIRRRVATGWFVDNQWVAQYTICFADLYRQALLAYQNGDESALPKAWRLSCDTSAHGRGLLIQDLVLGINAHINYDLALALHKVGIDTKRNERYVDHTAVNQVLQTAIDQLQDQVCDIYAPILRVLDFAGGRLDETLSHFSVAKAREAAWLSAVALANARDDHERQGLRAGLNDRAGVLARLILSPNPLHPWLIEALRHVERFKPWWECLTPPIITLSEPPARPM